MRRNRKAPFITRFGALMIRPVPCGGFVAGRRTPTRAHYRVHRKQEEMTSDSPFH